MPLQRASLKSIRRPKHHKNLLGPICQEKLLDRFWNHILLIYPTHHYRFQFEILDFNRNMLKLDYRKEVLDDVTVSEGESYLLQSKR